MQSATDDTASMRLPCAIPATLFCEHFKSSTMAFWRDGSFEQRATPSCPICTDAITSCACARQIKSHTYIHKYGIDAHNTSNSEADEDEEVLN